MSPNYGPDSFHSSCTPKGPDFSLEQALHDQGCRLVAGVDEVGRGPLAGPVVAAAVILERGEVPGGLNDSKKLTAKRREALFGEILATATVSWASINAAGIDAINIRRASLAAMTGSIRALPVTPDHVLVDGRDLPPDTGCPASAHIKGDGKSLSIAAASIVAKVVRDRMMKRADLVYPQYGFVSNMGYGSAKHLAAIADQAPCPLHRMSFSPMRDA